jgi:hypothetical protein
MKRKQVKKNEQQVLLAMACGATVEAAAKQADVHPRTVYRRMRDPKFRRELARIRGEMVGRTAGMLTATSLEAVKALHDLLKTGTPTLKHSAARTVLEFTTKIREIVDLESRMQDLEDELAELQGMRKNQGKRTRRESEDEPWQGMD